MVKAIGIDLGTSKCCVGVFRNGKVEIIPDKFGNKIVSSSVFFAYNGLAFDSCGINVKPGNTIFAVLRLMGRQFEDPVVQSNRKYLPFSIYPTSKGRLTIEVDGKRFYPEEIVAMLLVRLKQSADAFLEADVKDVVITTSGQLGLRFRRAIFDAAEIAGLNVLRIINSSTAAAIGHFSGGRDAATIDAVPAPPAATNVHVVKKKPLDKWNTLIFDLGAGALDVSVVLVRDGKWKVVSTVSDAQIGGEDVKNRLFEHFEAELKRKYAFIRTGSQFDYCRRTRERFLATSMRVKHKLSTDTEAVASFGHLFGTTENFKVTINRSFFDGLCFDMFQRVVKVVRDALLQAWIDHDMIDEVIILGGSSRIHTVERMISEMFAGKEITKLVNPEQVAATGAAIYAALLSGDEPEAGKDVSNQDVLHRSLGICCNGQTYMHTIIEPGTAIPVKKTETVSVKYDDNNEISVKVYEGDKNESTKNLNFLCEVKLNGIPLLPNHFAAIQVTFEVDAKGALTVCAHDKATDKSEGATFPDEDSCFSEEEKKVMISTHKNLMHDLQIKRQRISAMSRLETMITSIEANKRKRKMEEQAEHEVYKQVKKTFNWLEGNEVPKSDEFGRRLKLAEDLNRSFGSQFSSGT
uniref:Heat shock 70 kDa protein 14 n=1 Tax=Panagrellus redivivus TaxID=6233 RepID=A0A7E4UUS1_PANRE